jgi:hypothetical protein
VDKGAVMTNEKARVALRYHFSFKLMEKMPAKCFCGHKVGDGSNTLPSLQLRRPTPGRLIAAHDVTAAVRMIGAELNSYVRGGVYMHISREQIMLKSGSASEPTWKFILT